MRDLAQEGARGNGASEMEDVTTPLVERAAAIDGRVLRNALLKAQRDKRLSDVAVMLLDTAKMLDPVVEIVSSKLLRWAAMAAAVYFTFYALREPSWERASIIGVFLVCARVLLGKG
jgi:hypothetical protein